MLRVPSSFRETYIWLARLAPEEAEELLSAFDGAPEVSRRAIVRAVTASCEQDSARVEELVESTVSLVRSLQESSSSDLEKGAPDDLAADSSLDLSEAERAELAIRLRRLIGFRQVRVLAKAIDLQADHQYIFRSARIFSEIRPMFEDDVREPPRVAAVAHTLKLSFYDSNLDGDTMYIAMDTADLSRVAEVIQRELIKAETIEETLKRAGISSIDYNRED